MRRIANRQKPVSQITGRGRKRPSVQQRKWKISLRQARKYYRRGKDA